MKINELTIRHKMVDARLNSLRALDNKAGLAVGTTSVVFDRGGASLKTLLKISKALNCSWTELIDEAMNS